MTVNTIFYNRLLASRESRQKLLSPLIALFRWDIHRLSAPLPHFVAFSTTNFGVAATCSTPRNSRASLAW